MRWKHLSSSSTRIQCQSVCQAQFGFSCPVLILVVLKYIFIFFVVVVFLTLSTEDLFYFALKSVHSSPVGSLSFSDASLLISSGNTIHCAPSQDLKTLLHSLSRHSIFFCHPRLHLYTVTLSLQYLYSITAVMYCFRS